MNHQELIGKIDSRESFADYVRVLVDTLDSEDGIPEKLPLRIYLGAMAAWAGSLDSSYRNLGMELPEQPTWELVANMLYSAAFYD